MCIFSYCYFSTGNLQLSILHFMLHISKINSLNSTNLTKFLNWKSRLWMLYAKTWNPVTTLWEEELPTNVVLLAPADVVYKVMFSVLSVCPWVVGVPCDHCSCCIGPHCSGSLNTSPSTPILGINLNFLVLRLSKHRQSVQAGGTHPIGMLSCLL